MLTILHPVSHKGDSSANCVSSATAKVKRSLRAHKTAKTMKPPAPSKGSVCCLFSVFHGLVVKLHETNPTFLSETLEKPTEKRCLKTVLDWFGTTTNKVARTMAEFLQDARFQCLKPESLGVFF